VEGKNLNSREATILLYAPALEYPPAEAKALDEFSNKTGSFVRRDLYIYAYDFNGTNIAHPFKPNWIGKNKLSETDSNGVPYIRNLINVAKEGKGLAISFLIGEEGHNTNLPRIRFSLQPLPQGRAAGAWAAFFRAWRRSLEWVRCMRDGSMAFYLRICIMS
jgi:hypothetical protein